MSVWHPCKMEKSARTGKSQSWISVQIIVDVILWIAVGVPVLYLFLAGTPRDRGFFCDDDSINFPYKSDTISTPLLIVLGFCVSGLVVVTVEVLNSLERRCQQKQPGNLLCIIKCYCVFVVGFVVDQMFVEVVKNETGSLRPNFIDVCRPQFNSSHCPGYIMDYRCTSDASSRALRSSRQSFPSGHSAFSMYIAAYFCFYIQDCLHVTFSHILKMLLQAVLVLASTVCGVSRIVDNKHHMIDVIAGFLLGAVIALFVYKSVTKKLISQNWQENSRLPDDVERAPCCACDEDDDSATPTPLLLTEPKQNASETHPLSNPLSNTMFITQTNVEEIVVPSLDV